MMMMNGFTSEKKKQIFLLFNNGFWFFNEIILLYMDIRVYTSHLRVPGNISYFHWHARLKGEKKEIANTTSRIYNVYSCEP